MPDAPETKDQAPIDFAAAGLLDGLEEGARDERVALLEHLAATGSSLADLRRHSLEGTLMFVPAERVIGGPARYTADEVAERSEVDMEFLLALRQAMGLPMTTGDERAYAEADIDASRIAGEARAAGISEEEILDLTRILGRGLAQAAESMRSIILRLVLEPGLSERDLAERYARATEGMAPMTTPLVGSLLTLHLRHMAEMEAISAAERTGGRLPGSREIAVCFADLVGFTRVGEELQPDELGRLAKRLETMTATLANPPVKLVKMIGDAAMLTAPKAGPLLDSALALVDAVDGEGPDFPQLRVGVAAGPALSRGGDWFGRAVNLASRVTGVARPGSVLTTREVRDAARESYRWSSAGERRLKGIREPVALYRARALETAQ
jgi:adenylate cyclase